MTPEKAERPEHVEKDPRTDGVGDGGENELDPPTDEEVAVGVEHDEALREAQRRSMAARFDREDDGT